MRIQHNIMAMSAYRNYTNNVAAMKSNLEKLSSGYKINRAGDDAAGLAISEKMRAQITGLETAQKNAKDGISLVQTAEGALTEVHDMLNRMVELATQSANGTYDDTTDRAQLQKEMDQLKSEINRIADSSNFNGIQLLDGSMQSGRISGAEYESISNDDILKMIPPQEDKGQTTVEGQKTIVETDGAKATKASFSIKLDNLNAVDEDVLTLDIGGMQLSTNAGDIKAGMNASKIAALFDGKDITLSDDKGNSAKFEISVKDNILNFTATEATPFDPPKTVTYKLGTDLNPADAPKVTMTGPVDADGNPKGTEVMVTPYAYDATVTAATITKPSGGAAITALDSIANDNNATNDELDVDKILAAAKEQGLSGAVTIETDAAGKVSLCVGGTAIATSNDTVEAAIADSGHKDVSFGDFGSICFKADTSGTGIAAGALTDKVFATNMNIKTEGAKTANATIDDTDAFGTQLQTDGLLGDATGSVTVRYDSTAKKWFLNAPGLDSEKELTADATTTPGKLELTYGGATIAVDLSAASGNTGLLPTESDFQDAFANGKVIAKLGNDPTVTGTINGATQNIQVGSDGASDQVANTTLKGTDLEEYFKKDGTQIKLGDTTYTVALGPDSKFKSAENVIDLTDMTADNFDMKVAATRLTTTAKNNNGIFSIGHDGAGNVTLQQLSTAKDSTDMTTRAKIAEYIGISTVDSKSLDNVKTARGLTLQIGDTADSYNQLKVNINDCHTASLGLDDIKISDQESAATAVDAIKSAINYVSDVRGTLGATQNRLDHTINNLSVMTENIQDAESTIRDVDVAEEMMAYTKNNILIQASQAMLAQANQVPQGVLQLLQ